MPLTATELTTLISGHYAIRAARRESEATQGGFGDAVSLSRFLQTEASQFIANSMSSLCEHEKTAVRLYTHGLPPVLDILNNTRCYTPKLTKALILYLDMILSVRLSEVYKNSAKTYLLLNTTKADLLPTEFLFTPQNIVATFTTVPSIEDLLIGLQKQQVAIEVEIDKNCTAKAVIAAGFFATALTFAGAQLYLHLTNPQQ